MLLLAVCVGSRRNETRFTVGEGGMPRDLSMTQSRSTVALVAKPSSTSFVSIRRFELLWSTRCYLLNSGTRILHSSKTSFKFGAYHQFG